MSQLETDGFDFFELDQHRLDEEWVNQPKLYHRYAEQLADAREMWEKAKAAKDLADDELKKMEAEIDLDVRKRFSDYGFEKRPTEPAIANTVLVSPQREDYQQKVYQARRRIIATKHRVDVLESVVSAFDHRKKSLESFVQLFLANYYSQPRGRAMGQDRLVHRNDRFHHLLRPPFFYFRTA